MKNKTRKNTRLRSTAGAWLGALLLAGCAATSPPGGPSADGTTGEGGSAMRPVALPSPPPPAAKAADFAPIAAAALPAAAPTPVDPLQPDVKVDLDAATAHADLWARVRRGFAMPDLENDLVHDREQWYAARPDYVARMTGRSSRYLFHIVEEIERRGLPTELALLPFIESAFNPQAMSTAKASGMWQFIPSTGRDFLLRQNIFRDDRRDVLASTRAALDYLSRLYGTFGDWHLALAAYNWGEGSVQRAIDRNLKAGLPTDYASLHMPDETRLYVPKLQAVKNLIAKPQSFGLALPAVANHPYFLSVPIDRDIDVDVAVRLSGVPLDEFKTLNPQMNKPVILAAGTPQLLLPYDNANRFVKQLALHRGPLASWTAWVAPRTLRPVTAAQEVGMTEEDLREVNRIPFRMLIKAGSTLLVRRTDTAVDDVSGEVADNASMALTPEMMPVVRRAAAKPTRRELAAAAFVAGHRGAAPLAGSGMALTPEMMPVVRRAAAKPTRRELAATAFVAGHRGAAAPAGSKRPTAVAAAPAAAPLQRGRRSGTAVAAGPAGTARMLTLSPGGRTFVALPAPRVAAAVAAPRAAAARPVAAAVPARVAAVDAKRAARTPAAHGGGKAKATPPHHAAGGR